MDVERVVWYPFDGDGPTQVLIGGVLSLLSVLVLPVVFVVGYYYEVLHDTITGGAEPPEFTTDNIKQLAVKGLGVIGVFFATPCVLSYPANASFISYAATDSITSAVSPRNIIDVMTSKQYLAVNTVLLICGIVFVIVISVIQLLPVFGQVAAPFIQFIVLVLFWHALGTLGSNFTEQITHE